MVPVIGEGHFIDNRFMEERNLCEKQTLKIDVLFSRARNAPSVSVMHYSENKKSYRARNVL
jgi:hypothetical protein